MIRIEPYTAARKELWNGFVARARNSHVLFDRGFMDYHADRFKDASLLFFDDDTLLAVLPANRRDAALYSHQGLTFGGFIVAETMTSPRMLACFEALIAHAKAQGLRTIHYKPIPYIYARRPAQEDLYALFRANASLTRRDVTTTIDYRKQGAPSKRRLRGIKKSRDAGISFRQSTDWRAYWDMLGDTLASRHGVAPTHTLSEISLLAQRFPDNIRLFTAEASQQLLAGVVIFENSMVAHAQYICASEAGRACGALDGLFDHLIAFYRTEKSYFDFGISNEERGRVLNIGLVTQKEEFGGTAVVHEEYAIDIAADAARMQVA